MNDDPLFVHFEKLDHLLSAVAEHAAPDDETEQRRLIAWGWFLLATEPMYREICFQTIGVRE